LFSRRGIFHLSSIRRLVWLVRTFPPLPPSTDCGSPMSSPRPVFLAPVLPPPPNELLPGPTLPNAALSDPRKALSFFSPGLWARGPGLVSCSLFPVSPVPGVSQFFTGICLTHYLRLFFAVVSFCANGFQDPTPPQSFFFCVNLGMCFFFRVAVILPLSCFAPSVLVVSLAPRSRWSGAFMFFLRRPPLSLSLL